MSEHVEQHRQRAGDRLGDDLPVADMHLGELPRQALAADRDARIVALRFLNALLRRPQEEQNAEACVRHDDFVAAVPTAIGSLILLQQPHAIVVPAGLGGARSGGEFIEALHSLQRVQIVILKPLRFDLVVAALTSRGRDLASCAYCDSGSDPLREHFVLIHLGAHGLERGRERRIFFLDLWKHIQAQQIGRKYTCSPSRLPRGPDRHRPA